MPAAGVDFSPELLTPRQMPMVLSRSWLDRPSSIHNVAAVGFSQADWATLPVAETKSFEQLVLPSNLRFRPVGEAANERPLASLVLAGQPRCRGLMVNLGVKKPCHHDKLIVHRLDEQRMRLAALPALPSSRPRYDRVYLSHLRRRCRYFLRRRLHLASRGKPCCEYWIASRSSTTIAW
jgi:hypothetical protein